MAGDNFFADNLKASFADYSKQNPDQEFTYEEYQSAVSSSRAFEYDSIRDGQQNLELWRDIGAAIVIIGVSIVCPPAGLALGVAYGTLELSSAATGKDWMTGREMDGTERATRGAFALLDIIPGVKGIRALSTATKAGGVALDAAQVGSKLTLRQTAKQGLSHVDAMGRQALRESAERIRNVPRVISDVASSAANAVKTQIGKGAIQASKLADEVATAAINLSPRRIALMKDTAGGTHLVHNTAENAHRAESLVRSKISGELVEGLAQKAGKDFPTVRLKDTIASGFDEVGALKERWVVPKGYDSLDDFLKVVDDTTIKDFGYDSIDDFKTVVGHVDDYLKASPNNNILNKGLAGGTHMKGIDYDVLGFPIFKGDDMKFTFKLGEDKFVASDSSQFKKCTEVLQAAIKRGDIPKDMFTAKQLAQIEAGKARISGLTWHHHQVPGKMQLVNSQAHSVNHLGGNTLWGGGVR